MEVWRILGAGGTCTTCGTVTQMMSNGNGSTLERCPLCAARATARAVAEVAAAQLVAKVEEYVAVKRRPAKRSLTPFKCATCASIITPKPEDKGRPRKNCTTCKPPRLGQPWRQWEANRVRKAER